MQTRTLSIRRETLTELTPDDLAVVVGGSSGCFETLSERLGCVGTYQCPTYTC